MRRVGGGCELLGIFGGAEITGGSWREVDLRQTDGGWLGEEDEEETRWASGGAMGKDGWDRRLG